MKFSPETFSILKNFAAINTNFLFLEGNTQVTRSNGDSVFAKAEIEEEIPVSFGVFDLPQFLSVCDMLDDPTFDFRDTNVRITEGRKAVTYIYTNPDLVDKPDSTNVKAFEHQIEFDLPEDSVASLFKASRNLGLKDVAFMGDGKKVFAVVYDHKDKSRGDFKIDLDVDFDKKFEIIFSVSDLCLLKGSYKVGLTSSGIHQFVHKDVNLLYWVAMHLDSSNSFA
jgi:hypothetical protein